jgi:peptide-methionine (S)-S-oxide reductase
MDSIILGGGCFWCTEAVLKLVKGVKSVTPGYAGGHTKNPSYEEVCAGNTGHAEVVKVEYDPSEICLEGILDVFFRSHDPTSINRQGNDIGTQYRSLIISTKQDELRVRAFVSKIRGATTEIQIEKPFYRAEEYHVDYYRKNPGQPYCRLVIKPKLDKFK